MNEKIIIDLAVFILILGALLMTGATAEAKSDVEVQEVLSVYDGDTFTVILKDSPPFLPLKSKIRLAGVDTPEIRGKCEAEKLLAKDAKMFVQNLLSRAKTIKLRDVKLGMYGRFVAHVLIDDEYLANKLIANGLASPYQTRRLWKQALCESHNG